MFQVGDIVTAEGHEGNWRVTRPHHIEGAYFFIYEGGASHSYYIEGKTESAAYAKAMKLVVPSGPDEIEAMFS